MCKPSENDVTQHRQRQQQQQQQSCSNQSLHVKEAEEDETLIHRASPLQRRQQKNLRQRSCLAVFACLQNALVGGLVFGWASIDRTLLIATREDGGPGLSPMQTTTIFSWASSIAMLSSLLMGLVLDKCGPRTASVISNLCVGLGCWIFSRAHSFGGLAVGTCMMAFGGPGISSAIVHIANLFPKNQFLIMSVLCGSITCSFSILAIFGVLWEQYGVEYRAMFGGYTFVIMGSAMGAFCLWPDTPFAKEDSDSYGERERVSNGTFRGEQEPLAVQSTLISAEQEFVEATLAHHQLCEEPLNAGLRQNLTFGRTRSYLESLEAMAGDDNSDQPPSTYPTTISLKDRPFWNQVTSQMYLRNLLIFIVASFFVNFTIASISTELADQQVFSLEEQHDLSRSFTLIMSGGLVGSVLVGWSMDRAGLETCTIVTLLLGQTSLLLRMIGQTYPTMLLGFVVYTLFRQFLFPIYIACLTARLGFKYFGILSGIGFALSGTAQVFMASLVRHLAGDCHLQKLQAEAMRPTSCNHGMWDQFHLFQVILLFALLSIPLMDRWAVDARRRKAIYVNADNTTWTSRTKLCESHGTTLQQDNNLAVSYGSVVV